MAALENLLEWLHPPLRRYASRHMLTEPDGDDLAADLAQEGLLRIAAHLHECHGTTEREVVAWAFSIIRRICLDYYRSARFPSVFVRLDSEEGAFTQPRLLSQRTAAHSSRAMRALHRIVRRCVASLPPASQLLLRLRLEEHYTWPAIAINLGIGASAASNVCRHPYVGR